MPHLKNGSFPWNPSLKPKADALQDALAAYSDSQINAALDAEAYVRGLDFIRGVQAYHQHPYQRALPPAPTVWQEGGSRLLDYGGPKDGPVVLAIPSLVNKSYILDLTEKRSLMRTLSQKGVRSYLMDWGDVGPSERAMGLEDYIHGRLNRCVDHLIKETSRPVCLIGYCMGGVLATGLAALEPDKINGLALLATPWDFHAGEAGYHRFIQASQAPLQQTIDNFNELPVDVLQSLFAAIDPYSILSKFEDFSRLDPASAEAQQFVAMEDWLNDGVPLSAPVAKECLFDWYIHNKPHHLGWDMDGHVIDPRDITCPTVLFIPEKDRIVPRDSARALGCALANAEIKHVKAGHIGMVTGKSAKKCLYDPLSKWLISQNF
ncbi:alpha/beta fold hydrolase [Terasakiella pusilla]|uniref:alpha/beta fold hydrolase n=1 Tax=Terasakiella pusilla TaxID=64973 RepID=UPI003AA858A5